MSGWDLGDTTLRASPHALPVCSQRASGQPGLDTTGFQTAFIDTAGSNLYRLRASVPLEAGKMLHLTQDVALGSGSSRIAPWRVLRTDRRIAPAA